MSEVPSITVRTLYSNETVKLSGMNYSMYYRFGLKPYRDNLVMLNFERINSSSTIFEEGFHIDAKRNMNYAGDYDIVSYYWRGVNTLMRCVRHEDMLLDEPANVSIEGEKFSDAISLILGNELNSEVCSEISDINVSTCSPPGTSRRDIIQQLAMDLGFFWYINLNGTVIFATRDDRTTSVEVKTDQYKPTTLMRTVGGWVGTSQETLMLPGTVIKFGNVESTVLHAGMEVKLKANGFFTNVFVDDPVGIEIEDYRKYLHHLRSDYQQSFYNDNINPFIADIHSSTDSFYSGVSGDTPLHGIIETSPWWEGDQGILFP